MTIAGRKGAVTKGSAKLLFRILRGQSGAKPDWRSCYKPEAKHQVVFVEFNTKDELELQFTLDRDEMSKVNKENVGEGRAARVETFRIEEIADCVAHDTEDVPNTLLVETLKRGVKEDLVLKFDNEQEFRRTLFTFKYFKMRNRLANSSETSDGKSSPNLSTRSKSSYESNDNSPASPANSRAKGFDYSVPNGKNHFIKNVNCNFSNNNFGVKSLDYLSVNGQIQKHKSAYEQRLGELAVGSKLGSKQFAMSSDESGGSGHGERHEAEAKSVGEIDGLIYTDLEYESMDYNSLIYSPNPASMPMKPQRRKQVLRRVKGKAPPPPGMEKDLVKAPSMKVNLNKLEKIPTKDVNSVLSKCQPTVPRVHVASNGYESDREEWRSRSTFSSSAFHSLARPARHALAAYYRNTPTPPTPVAPTQPIALKPSPRNPRNLQDFSKNFINSDYMVFSHIQDKRPTYQQDLHQFQNLQQKQEQKYGKMLFKQEFKRNTLGGSMNYLNISNRLHGITDNIKEIGYPGSVKPHWQRIEKDRKDRGQLKPVIKKSHCQTEGSKRPIVRTCSAEPPKKVTFSAFATVQVV